jgi:hypothetical protein
MSYLLEALKKAEQKCKRERVSGPGATNPPAAEVSAGSSAWEVEMVSPARFIRYRAKRGERTEEAGGCSLPKGLTIAMALLALLTLLLCAIAYDVRGRISDVTAAVNRVSRKVSETKSQLAELDGDQTRLNIENGSLRQEKEAAMVELARARQALERLKVSQQRATVKKSVSPTTGRKGPHIIPPAFAPAPLTGPTPSVEERPTD